MATFWEIAARSVSNLSHCILSLCNIYLFSVLALRAGFAFSLLQFLFIAFLLLLKKHVEDGLDAGSERLADPCVDCGLGIHGVLA